MHYFVFGVFLYCVIIYFKNYFKKTPYEFHIEPNILIVSTVNIKLSEQNFRLKSSQDDTQAAPLIQNSFDNTNISFREASFVILKTMDLYIRVLTSNYFLVGKTSFSLKLDLISLIWKRDKWQKRSGLLTLNTNIHAAKRFCHLKEMLIPENIKKLRKSFQQTITYYRNVWISFYTNIYSCHLISQ